MDIKITLSELNICELEKAYYDGEFGQNTEITVEEYVNDVLYDALTHRGT